MSDFNLEGMSSEEVQALAALAKSVRDNPATRKRFFETVKEANPNLSIPEIDVERGFSQHLKTRDEEIAKLRAEQEQERRQREARDRIDQLKDAGVISSANEFNEVVKYASENGFQVTDAGLKRAAEARRREQESAVPTPTHVFPRPSNDNKDLMRNPQQWARNEASKIMDELIAQRGKR